MKACAKERGVSTSRLLEMIHAHKWPHLSSKRQASLRSLLGKAADSDSDFKAHPRTQQTRRKRGRPVTEKLEYVYWAMVVKNAGSAP